MISLQRNWRWLPFCSICLLLFTTNLNSYNPSEKPPAPYGVQSMTEYENRIGEPGLLLEDENIQMWVPQTHEQHSRVIFSYLQSGYATLKDLFGDYDMSVKFSIEHYPTGSIYISGGTDTQGTIRYGYVNLIDDYPEWNLHGVPHVIGYYEEMAHCFVAELGLKDGFYETIGMMIGGEAGLRSAGNPYLENLIADDYQTYADSTAYFLDHDSCEPGITENICLTRILAHVYKTEVIDIYGWESLTSALSAIQAGFPLRMYDSDHTWGGFLEFLNEENGVNYHDIFGEYGLPIINSVDPEKTYMIVRSSGIKSNDSIVFQVKIIDREGNMPTDIKLHYYQIDGYYFESPMNFVSGNSQDGYLYQFTYEFERPFYYAFSANDGVHPIFQAIGTPTVKEFFGWPGHVIYLPAVKNYQPSNQIPWQIGNRNDNNSEFDNDPHNDPEIMIYNIGQPFSQFPGGLGTDIGLQRSIININFNGNLSNVMKLKIRWSPGGTQTLEQFSIYLDDNYVGVSEELSGQPTPNIYVTETFNLPYVAGNQHTLRLEHLKGDGNFLDVLCLGLESQCNIP